MKTVELVGYNPNALDLIEQAASVCYDSEPTDGHYIMKDCISNGHTSVTEYANFVFKVEGVSRALLAQITRHRVGVSFTVRSQRYCSEDNFNYVKPKTIEANSSAEAIYNNTMYCIANAYKRLQELGIPNEDARMILPNACETTFYVQFNLRSLMHFFNERLCTRAQWEIRELAQLMRDEVLKVFPELKSYLVPKCEQFKVPFCPEKKCCGRHQKLEDLIPPKSSIQSN